MASGLAKCLRVRLRSLRGPGRRTGLDEPTAVAHVREAILAQQRLGRPRAHPAVTVGHDRGAQIPVGEGQHLEGKIHRVDPKFAS